MKTELQIAKDNAVHMTRMWQVEAEVSEGRRIHIEKLETELAAAQEHAERLHSELTRVIKCASKFGARVRERTPHWFEEPKGFTDFSDADHALRAALIDGQEALAAPSGQRFVRREVLENLLNRVKSWFNSHPPMAFDDVISESSAELARTAPETIAQEGGENTEDSSR